MSRDSYEVESFSCIQRNVWERWHESHSKSTAHTAKKRFWNIFISHMHPVSTRFEIDWQIVPRGSVSIIWRQRTRVVIGGLSHTTVLDVAKSDYRQNLNRLGLEYPRTLSLSPLPADRMVVIEGIEHIVKNNIASGSFAAVVSSPHPIPPQYISGIDISEGNTQSC